MWESPISPAVSPLTGLMPMAGPSRPAGWPCAWRTGSRSKWKAATTTAAAPGASLVEDVVAAEPAPDLGTTGEPIAAASEEAEPTKEEGLARIGEIAERTAGSGPRADDDLKKVHGIGPKLERTLKGLGITSFRQIANFQSDDIAFVTAALDAFKGRIERDDWMSSAAEEHAKKYGEPV